MVPDPARITIGLWPDNNRGDAQMRPVRTLAIVLALNLAKDQQLARYERQAEGMGRS